MTAHLDQSAGSLRLRYSLFLALLLTIHLADGIIAPRFVRPSHSLIFAAAATIDLVVVVAALYYWLLIRPGLKTYAALIPVLLVGITHAAYFYSLPKTVHAGLMGLCETAVLGFVALQFRRVAKAGSRQDPVLVIRSALHRVLSMPLATEIIAGELSILYYALFSWSAQPHIPTGAKPFTIYKSSGKADILALFPVACFFEMVPVHLILARWSPLLAWLATGTSIYAMIWMVGLARAFSLRPSFVSPEELCLRLGLFFQVRIPIQQLSAIRPATPADQTLSVPRRTPASTLVEFHEAAQADRLFGIRTRVPGVAFSPDSAAEFASALAVLPLAPIKPPDPPDRPPPLPQLR